MPDAKKCRRALRDVIFAIAFSEPEHEVNLLEYFVKCDSPLCECGRRKGKRIT